MRTGVSYLPRAYFNPRYFTLTMLAMALPVSATAFQVEGRVDRTTVRVGEVVTFTVRVMPSGDEPMLGVPRARLIYGDQWLPGEQSIGTEDSAGIQTSFWRFNLRAMFEGRVRVIPVFYPDSASQENLGQVNDSVLGSPIALDILPAPTVLAKAFQVVGKANRTTSNVGDEVTFTVRLIPAVGEAQPPIARARILYGPEWAPGGQSIAYEEQSGVRIKAWQFDLLALAEGPARVTPVVYPDSAAREAMGLPDSVLGSPIVMQILPAPLPARWPRAVALVSVMAILATTALMALRAYQKRQSDRRSIPPDPLTEALSLLDDIHVHCREDRTVQYLSELNRVLQGYLSRRLGRAMPTATPTELIAEVTSHLSDGGPLVALDQLLRRCVAAKYSGSRIRIEDLQATEALARSTLERLDRVWVRESPPAAST